MGASETRGRTPKHGLIIHSPVFGQALARNKGLIACYLAPSINLLVVGNHRVLLWVATPTPIALARGRLHVVLTAFQVSPVYEFKNKLLSISIFLYY